MLDGESLNKQEYNKMVSGEYWKNPYLIEPQNRAELLNRSYNPTLESDIEKRKDVLLNAESHNKQEYIKMVSGEYYNWKNPFLIDLQKRAELLYRSYNWTLESDVDTRKDIFSKLFGSFGKNLVIRAPFYCDYGINLHLGDNVYMNLNCVILDCAKVTIGNNTMFGPDVKIFTAAHPIDAQKRISDGFDIAKEIVIGNNVWIGGGAIVNPGVTIGDNAVIGSGSVVTKNIPSNCVAVGNPCKVIKILEEKEK